jgi:hypothetical protein
LCSIFAISGVSKSISPILIANEKNAEEEILHEIETSHEQVLSVCIQFAFAAGAEAFDCKRWQAF